MILGIFIVLGFMNGAYAWGVAYEDNYITMKEGQTQEIRMSLQNMMSDKELTVFAELRGDMGIAEISEEEIVLPPQTRSHPIYMTVTIPEDAEDRYTIKAVFIETQRGGIMVNLAMEKVVTYTIDVIHEKYVPPPPTTTSTGGSVTIGGDGESTQTDTQEESGDAADEKQDAVAKQERITAVPDSSEAVEEEPMESAVAGGFPIWWAFAVIIIISALGYAWWDGWI